MTSEKVAANEASKDALAAMDGDDEDEEVVTTTTKKVIATKVENDDLFGEKKDKSKDVAKTSIFESSDKSQGLDQAPAHIITPSTTTSTTTTVVPKVTKSYDDDNGGDDFDDYDNDDFDDLDHIEMGEDIVSPTTKGTRHDGDHADNAATQDEIAALQRELEELEHQEALLSKALSMR